VNNLQTVYIVIDDEWNEDEDYTLMNGTGEFQSNLKEEKGYFFTPEELKQLLKDYTNRIVENTKIEAEPEIGKITIKKEIDISEYDMLKCNYVFGVNKESITSQLEPFLKEIL